jgi:hypothetical protein
MMMGSSEQYAPDFFFGYADKRLRPRARRRARTLRPPLVALRAIKP